jgi:predicted O-methyltransferase YrrM
VSLKQKYISGTRKARLGLEQIGALAYLDNWASRSRTGQWVRSLFSAYDLDDFAQLDVPWWTYRSSDLVAKYLSNHPKAQVLEWGSGASTLWLAKRADFVVSIEHDPEWAETLRTRLPDNVDLVCIPAEPAEGDTKPVLSRKSGFEGLDFAAYVEAGRQVSGTFDVIVIDGRAREACLPIALDKLAPRGIIVFDNVDRKRYREAIHEDALTSDVLWTRGLTPILPYPTRTALLRKTR